MTGQKDTCSWGKGAGLKSPDDRPLILLPGQEDSGGNTATFPLDGSCYWALGPSHHFLRPRRSREGCPSGPQACLSRAPVTSGAAAATPAGQAGPRHPSRHHVLRDLTWWLRPALMGSSTPWKLANTVNRDCTPPAHLCVRPAASDQLPAASPFPARPSWNPPSRSGAFARNHRRSQVLTGTRRLSWAFPPSVHSCALHPKVHTHFRDPPLGSLLHFVKVSLLRSVRTSVRRGSCMERCPRVRGPQERGGREVREHQLPAPLCPVSEFLSPRSHLPGGGTGSSRPCS